VAGRGLGVVQRVARVVAAGTSDGSDSTAVAKVSAGADNLAVAEVSAGADNLAVAEVSAGADNLAVAEVSAGADNPAVGVPMDCHTRRNSASSSGVSTRGFDLGATGPWIREKCPSSGLPLAIQATYLARYAASALSLRSLTLKRSLERWTSSSSGNNSAGADTIPCELLAAKGAEGAGDDSAGADIVTPMPSSLPPGHGLCGGGGMGAFFAFFSRGDEADIAARARGQAALTTGENDLGLEF
jgi:hypothetical protein